MKNRSNIAASILQNGDMLRSVYEDAQNSEGSATEELNKELDSVEAKLQQLSNRAQEFWATLIDSDLLKNGIDLLSTLLGGLNDLMDAVGVLPTLLGAVGAGLSVKNVGMFKADKSGFTIGGKTIGEIGDDFNKLSQIVSDKTQKINSEISTFRDNLASNKETTPTWNYDDIQSDNLSELDDSNYSIAEKIREQNEYNELLENENSSTEAAIELSRRRTQNYDETLPKLSEINDKFEEQSQLEAKDNYNSTIKDRNNEYEEYLSNLEAEVEESEKVQDSIQNASSNTLEALGYKEKSYLEEVRKEQEEFSDSIERIETAPVDSLLPPKEEVTGYYDELLAEQQEFQNRLNAIQETPLDALATDQYSEILTEEADGQMALNLATTEYNGTLSAQNELSSQRVLTLTEEADGQMALTLAEQEGTTARLEDVQQTEAQILLKEAVIEASNKELLVSVNQKLATMGLTDATDALTIAKLKEIAAANNEGSALAKATLKMVGFEGQSKATTIALKGLAMAGNMFLMWGISEAVGIIYDMITASDRLAESASKLGSEFASTKTEISDYKTQIEGLYETINDDTSSYEDTYNARQELLSIQDEMIEKFGDEANAISLVTDAINGQTEALDTLTEQQWQETINSYNSGEGNTFREKISDAIYNGIHDTTNYQRMIDEMEDTTVSFKITPQYNDDTYNEFLNKLEDDFGVVANRTDAWDIFTLSGDLDTIHQQLLSIQTLGQDMGIKDSLLKDLGDQADEAKSKLEEYSELYSQHILYDKIFDSDDYTESFNEINEAYKKWQEAFEGGDEDAISKAEQNYAKIVQDAIEGIDDQSVIDYFNTMYPELQEIVGGWEFEVKFKAAIEDDSDDFEKEIQDAVSQFDTTEDIYNYDAKTATDKQVEAHLTLEKWANYFNLTIDQLIAKLAELGLVQSQAKSDLLNKLVPSKSTPTAGISFTLGTATSGVNEDEATSWVESLTEEEAKLANSEAFEKALEDQKEKLNGAALSADDYEAALQTVKDAQNTVNETPISFADAWADLDNLDSDSPYADVKEQLEELADAGQLTAKSLSEVDGAEEYFEDIGLSAEEAAQRVNALADESTQLASMGSQISKMSDALATKKEDGYVDYSTLSGFDDKIKDLDNWDAFQNALGSSTSSMEECQEAANALANEWVNSNSFLSNLTDANKDYYVTQLKNMGVSNALEVVNSRLTNTENAFAQAQLETSKYANTLTGAKKDSSLATKDLSNMTVEEIQQLYNEMVAANADTEALRLLLAQKYNVNNLSIATAADCLALADLYTYSEETRGSLLELAAAKSAAYTTNVGTAAGNDEDRKDLEKRTEEAQKEAEEALNNAKNGPDLKISQYGSGNNNNTTTDKDGSSSGSSDSKEEIDWIERKLSVLQTAIDLTKSKLENLFKVKSKSNNIQKQISQTKDLLDATRKAATRYRQEANKVKLSDELKKKVRNGDYDITEYSSEIANAINEYQEKYDNYKSMQQQVQELKQSIRELKQDKNQLYIDRADARQEKSEANQANKRVNNAKALNKSVEYQKKQVRQSYNYQIKNAKLDKDSVKVATLKAEKQEELRKLTLQEAENIQAAYDNRLKSNEATQDAIADALTLAETQGNVIGKAYYTGQIATTKKDLKERQKELTDLQNKQKSIKKYTQEWYDAQEMIDDVKAAIRQDEISIAEFQNSINELKWDRFDELINKIDDVTTEIDFLKNTLSDTLFDDKGMITDDGLTAMGLTLMSGNAAMSKRDYYKQQLAQLEKDYANGNGSIGYTTYIERQREYNQGLQDSISSIVEAKKATVDYVEQGLDAQNEALSEAIEKKKELLEEEKD